MADNKLFVVGSHGTDDPTHAVMPFVAALGAKTSGIDVEIALIIEAVYLMKDDVAKTVHGVGFPPLTELLQQTIEQKIPIHV
jgi:predicted peroxiredoxin